MLPFLNPKKAVGVIVAKRGKSDLHDVSPEADAPDQDYNHELESACEDLLRAIDERSIKGMAAASNAIHQACDKELHEEGPHSNEHEDMESEAE